MVALVRAVLSGDGEATRRLLPGVLAIGHTSGGDLVSGLAGALFALTVEPCSFRALPTVRRNTGGEPWLTTSRCAAAPTTTR